MAANSHDLTKVLRRLRMWWMRRYELPRMRATIEQLKKDYQKRHSN